MGSWIKSSGVLMNPETSVIDGCTTHVIMPPSAIWGVTDTATPDGRPFVSVTTDVDVAGGEYVSTIDTSKPYAITGYPRVADGKVLIGNAGAEYGVRGYVSAYDALTGDRVWRTYTVPGNPADGFESEALRMAAETWSGEWWVAGGGGTAWDAMAYDPELELLYVGTGNG